MLLHTVRSIDFNLPTGVNVNANVCLSLYVRPVTDWQTLTSKEVKTITGWICEFAAVNNMNGLEFAWQTFNGEGYD